MNTPKVVMLGLGYIGLPTAAAFAGIGLCVHGVDVNLNVVQNVRQGRVHIVEPDLAGLVAKSVAEGRLTADIRPTEGDVFIVAVPTPFKDGHEPDLTFVEAATDAAIPFLRPGNLFILESTSPVGTTDLMAARIFAKRPELQGRIHIAYCPERVLPGNVLHELVHNDRAIGGIDRRSTENALAFYRLLVKAPLHPTTARTAEMSKLVENAYRDVNVAFANELSILCQRFGVNVWELIHLANKHPRVQILSPGCGVGGHCIAVDPWFLVSAGCGEAKVIQTARERNDEKAQWAVKQILLVTRELESTLGRRPRIACMGLAFKPDIDDLRESPALKIARTLAVEGWDPMFVEPNIQSMDGLALTPFEAAVDLADIIVFLVGHREFKDLQICSGKKVIDFCGVRNLS